MSSEQKRIALAKLSRHYGYNRGAIAEALGVKLITVYKWFSHGQISRKCAFKAELATDGKIKAYELRPDVAEFKVV